MVSTRIRILPPVLLGLALLILLAWTPAAGAKPREQARSSATGSEAASFPGQPPYARLFEKGESLLREGSWTGALRMFSRIYQEEVPVDAFYRTLERRILEVLAGLEPGAGFRLGKERYLVSDLGLLFQRVLLPQPEVVYSRLDTRRELPLARFLYLCVVAGQPHPRPPANRMLEYALPRLDLKRALASPDPWLVSAALFLARKGLGRLRARAVVERWQAWPDLWDQVCTDQALLFLAGRPRSELAGLKVGQSPGDLDLARLKPLAPGRGCPVQALIFWVGSLKLAATDYLGKAHCARLRVRGASPDSRDEKPPCSGEALRLAPGKYILRYLSSRAQGQSQAFTCRAGGGVRLVIPVMGHI